MKRMFVISLSGIGITKDYYPIGFLSTNNKDMIATYIKKQYGLILQDELPNKFSFENGNRWNYSTNVSDVIVHVDICHNLKEPKMNKIIKIVKIILNTLIYLIEVFSVIVITLTILAIIAGYGDKSILTLIKSL